MNKNLYSDFTVNMKEVSADRDFKGSSKEVFDA